MSERSHKPPPAPARPPALSLTAQQDEARARTEMWKALTVTFETLNRIGELMIEEFEREGR